MNSTSQVFVDPNGDVELVIQSYRFVVSSSRMSATSPEFRKVFDVQDSSSSKRVELSNEDPVVFYLICQSAHGAFIPEAHISLDLLVKLADTIRRYEVPTTSSIYEAIKFCFEERTRLLETISTPDLTMFLQVARDLGSAISIQLLEDTFLLHPFYFESLPIESALRDLKLKGAACRVQVVNILLLAIAETVYQHQNYHMASWILSEGPSLREISSRLDWEMKQVSGHQFYQLLNARRTIDQAKANVSSHLRPITETDFAGEEGEVSQQETTHLGPVRRLEVQIACDAQDMEASSSAWSPASSSASSSGTQFEDIEAYCKSEKYDHYDYFDDNESLKSFKTI
jgi:hypothetical protein